MAYIDIINNSEKYISLLKNKDKIYVKLNDIRPSEYLVTISDTLSGYYDVKSFTINQHKIYPDDFFVNYKIICGDFFCGEGLLQKINKKNSSQEWIFN